LAIRYEPKKILKRLASKKNVERLITDKLTVNKAAVNAIEQSGVIGKKELQFIAMGVVQKYRDKVEVFQDEGFTKADAIDEVLDDKRLLVQRVQNAVVRGITASIKEKYHGYYYTWLKSTANEPDEEHKKKWGKVFQIGKGEAPGERYGCQCGMEIHVDETKLSLD
jgi:hypothetical protein